MADEFDLAYAIRLPNRQAIEYFQARTPSAAQWNWFDVLGDAHAKSFVVAKAVRADVLRSIHDQMRRAIERGMGETEFVRNLEINLKKLGWWGKQVIVDADGGAEVVRLGSPHRLRTIYRTNMEVGVAHGRYRRQVDNAENRPYWKYEAVLDQRTRPTHAAMHGKVFRANDPIWKTHYPPNGFGCRCAVVALTAREMEKEGLSVSDSGDDLHPVEQQAGVNKRTGEVITVRGTQYRFTGRDGKAHVMTPDPGWNYNPGYAGGGNIRRLPRIRPQQTLSDELGKVTVPKLEVAPPAVARAQIQEVLQDARFDAAVRARDVRKWPMAVISPEIENAIAGAGATTAAQIVTSRVGPTKFKDHPELTADRLRNVQDALDHGEVLIEPPGRDKQGDRHTLIAYYEEDGGWWRHVVHVRPTQLLLRTVFRDRDSTFRTEDVLRRPGLVTVRAWDENRWRDRPKDKGK